MSYRALRVIRVACVLVAVAGLVAAPRASRDRSAVEWPASTPGVPDSTIARGATRMARALESDNPFRTTRRHPSLRFDPDRPPPPTPSPPPPPPIRPPWRVTGILAGPNPVAVFDGLPAPDSTRLVQIGDTVEGRVVMDIVNDSVTLAERDSMWSFVLAFPWAGGGSQ